MPFKYEDSEDQDHRRNKRQKIQSIQHIRSTKAACLEEERQADLVDALEDEVRNEGAISAIVAKYDKDIAEARAKLRESRRRIQRVRKGIRDAGGAEFDSLLSVGDSVSRIITFLDFASIGRCEQTSKSMKIASEFAWKQIGPRYTSTFGDSAREKTARFGLASLYARRAESQINKHQMEGHEKVCWDYKKPNECDYCGKLKARWQIDDKEEGDYKYDDPDEEWDQGDDDSCCFPDTLNKSAIKPPERFEMFMRVTDSKVLLESKVLFEGFIPQEQVKSVTRRNGKVGLDINFRGMEFPKWQDMEQSLSLDIQKDKEEWLNGTSHIPCITLLAIPKKLPEKMTSVKSLSTALVGCFGHANVKEIDELDHDYGDAIPNFAGFEFENDIYRIRVGSVAASNPHTERDDPCRYMYLAWSKENGVTNGKFAGLRVEDWQLPTDISSYRGNEFYDGAINKS